MATALELARNLEQKRGELSEFLKSKTTDAGLDFRGDDIKSFNDRNEELNELQDKYDQVKRVESVAKANEAAMKAMNEPNRTVGFSAGGGEGQNGKANVQASTKSIGEIFTESEEYKMLAGAPRPNFVVEIPNTSVKSVFTTATGYVPYPPQQSGSVGFAVRRPVVADLIPQTDTNSPSIIYMEQTTQTFNADTVAQGAVKPESAFAWTRRTVPMEVIAHTLPITNQALEDVPGIQDIINQQMTLGVQLAEESQILNGTGTTPDLQGFLTKTGVQTQAKGADDIFTAAMKAFTLIRHTGFADVTGGVMHPNDWLDIVTLKDTTGRFIYGNPQEAGPQRLWGVPIIVTTAMTENTALFGDFVMYSRLWRMHGIRIIVGYVNDDLVRNQQTLVAEERVALQIGRAAAFAKVTGA